MEARRRPRTRRVRPAPPPPLRSVARRAVPRRDAGRLIAGPRTDAADRSAFPCGAGSAGLSPVPPRALLLAGALVVVGRRRLGLAWVALCPDRRRGLFLALARVVRTRRIVRGVGVGIDAGRLALAALGHVVLPLVAWGGWVPGSASDTPTPLAQRAPEG